MAQNNTTTNQWLVFTLADQKYAIHVDCVRELTPSRDHEIRPLPQTPDHVVGALSLRGKVIAVRDLRTFIGLPSLEKETKEIVQLLEAREQDHIKWVAELKRSVDDECEFTLARDPHQCAFGKWYDELMSDESRLQKLTNSNFTLYRLIGQLDTPHKTIHSIADRVTRFVRENDTEGAHRIIEVTSREELDTMVTLLNQIRELLHSLRKPVIIVLEAHDRQLGMQVDAVDSVVRIQPDQIQPIPDRLGNSELFSGVSQLKDEEGLLMMLDGTTLFSDSSVADDTITRAAPSADEAAANSRPDRSQGRTLAIAQ